ncbi:hypothetical protein I4U23_014478 [Adineta vaga]|nr:hypothetical protein I4U23_014478 [Adineta vaga]
MISETNSFSYQYNENMLANKYAKCSFYNETRPIIHGFSLKTLIHQVQALSSKPMDHILDIGCVEGYMTRLLVHDDIVNSATGIDISKDMIALAKDATRQAEKNQFEYYAMTVKEFQEKHQSIDQSSLVISTFMICHIENVKELYEVLSQIRRLCSDFFVGLLPNPFLNKEDAVRLHKYNIRYNISPNIMDGDKVDVTFDVNTDNQFTLTDFWYSSDTYEKAFREAGFTTFQWVPLEIDPKTTGEKKAFFSDVSYFHIGFIARV